MPKFAERMGKLGAEGAFVVKAKAEALERKGKTIGHFEIGEPDFATPKHIIDAAKAALDRGMTHYSPSRGLHELREAVAEYVSRDLGMDISTEEVTITTSAKLAIYSTLMVFIDPGDEVVIPSPVYPSYAGVTRLIGAKPVSVKLKEERKFSPSSEEIAAAVTDKTKAIVINTPSNPTGGIYTRDDLRAIVDIASDRDLLLVSDEIYDKIIFDGGKHVSALHIQGARERTVLVNGFSKTWAMTGWRLGWVVAPAEVAANIGRIQGNTVSCPVHFSQAGAIQALKGPWEPIEAMVREYAERRDLIYDGLNAIPGIHMIKPAATFYAFPNVMGLGLKSSDLADRLLNEAGVALLPGTAFGAEGEGYLRLSFATSKENIREGLRRIGEFVRRNFPGL